jgi:carboxymethylenebutenolidase
MGQFTTIMARDGHEFQAWLAAPAGRPRGAVVVLQEIFGLNSHIRAVTDDFAAQGYTAIAPALFDRIRRGIELKYTPEDSQVGMGYVKQLDREATLRDVAAAMAVVKNSGRIGVVGYCWGGVIAYLTACQLRPACAVVYYGNVRKSLGQPKCPLLFHFGGADQSIPAADVEAIRAAHPESALYVYPDAGHGFNCDQRASFDREAATLARSRTLEFLERYLVGSPAGREASAS